MITVLIAIIMTGGSASIGSLTDGGGLTINEIMISPLASSSTDMGQWVELYNNSGNWINLSEWTLENESGEKIQFSSHVIPPEGFFVVGASALLSENGNYTPDAVWGDFSLASYGSLLISSFGSDGSEFVSWDGLWDLEEGSSLERLNPGWASSDRESWLHSTTQYGDGDNGTPGQQNSVFSNGFGQNTWAFIKAFVH